MKQNKEMHLTFARRTAALRATAVCFAVLLTLMLSSCGKDSETKGEATITSEWTCVAFTSKGNRTSREEAGWDLNRDRIPSFASIDGKKCVMIINSRSRSGPVEEVGGGVYHLSFEGNGDTFTAVIKDRTMTITNGSGSASIEFEAE